MADVASGNWRGANPLVGGVSDGDCISQELRSPTESPPTAVNSRTPSNSLELQAGRGEAQLAIGPPALFVGRYCSTAVICRSPELYATTARTGPCCDVLAAWGTPVGIRSTSPAFSSTLCPPIRCSHQPEST